MSLTERDQAILVAMDNIERYQLTVRELINGTANPQAVFKDMGKKAGVKPPTNGAVKPGGLDLEVASREDLIDECIRLGYSRDACKGKRVQTLRDMVKEREQTTAPAPKKGLAPPKLLSPAPKKGLAPPKLLSPAPKKGLLPRA